MMVSIMLEGFAWEPDMDALLNWVSICLATFSSQIQKHFQNIVYQRGCKIDDEYKQQNDDDKTIITTIKKGVEMTHLIFILVHR
jgi:hypothetical protein